MSIPNEAVAAATMALAGSSLKLEAAGWTFDYEALARAALEAAAPHLMSEAWDACAEWPSRPRLEDNPYRSAK